LPSDNSDLEGKLLVREAALAASDSRALVLDAFAGEGHMYSHVWHRAAGYLGLERRFSRPPGHPRGECWRGDNRRLLEHAMARAAWTIVDLDAYGSPWQLFRRVAQLARTDRLAVTLTCGLSRNLCSDQTTPWVQALTGTRGLSYTGMLVRWYDDVARWTIDYCLTGTGFRVERVRRAQSRRNVMVWYWLVQLAREKA
jgi:hypothetical protein